MNSFIGRIGLALLATLAWHSVLAHEDHSSRHGGFVMMFLEMHFELVLPEEGGVQLYYSDATRIEMPASVVSSVAIEIERPGLPTESVAMSISDSGDYWHGDSAVVVDPDSIVRVAFLYQGEPFILDIPYSVFPPPMDQSMPEGMHENMESMEPMEHGSMPVAAGCYMDCAG
jgi:hypothetical protein